MVPRDMLTFNCTFKKQDESGLMRHAGNQHLSASPTHQPRGSSTNDSVILFGEEMFSERVVFGSTTRPSRWKLTQEAAPHLSAFHRVMFNDVQKLRSHHSFVSQHLLKSWVQQNRKRNRFMTDIHTILSTVLYGCVLRKRYSIKIQL
jgi:hypothetical protein